MHECLPDFALKLTSHNGVSHRETPLQAKLRAEMEALIERLHDLEAEIRVRLALQRNSGHD